MGVAPAGRKRRALGSFRASFLRFLPASPDAACPIGQHPIGSAHHEWQRSDTLRLCKDERSNWWDAAIDPAPGWRWLLARSLTARGHWGWSVRSMQSTPLCWDRSSLGQPVARPAQRPL